MHGVRITVAGWLLIFVRRVVVRIVSRLLAICTTDHPSVIGERWQALADAALCVPVAAEEEDHDGHEDDDDDCVAYCHASLNFNQ